MITTTVQGTVYLANGQPGSGMLHVSWPAFTTANGLAIVADSADVTIGQDGFLSLKLAPNQGAMPGGLYYTAVFYMSDGSVSTQYWVVPAAAQATLAQVQVQVMPASQAVQAVNKAYVDNAIAQVSQSALTGSGGTLTGPLFLSGDPTQPMQAADKHYVDLAISQSGGSNVNPASAGQIAVYAQNGTSVNGMSTVPLIAGGTGAATAAGALQNLGGVSSSTSSAQTLAGPLNLSAPYDSNTTNMLQAATAQNVRNVAPRSVKEFGAKGDGKFNDFKMAAGSNVVQLVDAFTSFSPSDVGKLISLPNVDSDHGALYTTITGYTDATHVTVAANATYAFDGTGTYRNQAMWVSDDTAAIVAAITAATTGRTMGAGLTLDRQGKVYLPCGYFGATAQISIPTGVIVEGESGCSAIMYVGTNTIDAVVQVVNTGTSPTTNILRSGYYLTNTNHPEIGGCTGTACSPAITGLSGTARNLTIYGNKFSNWDFSVLEPANYLAENILMYGGKTGCFYHLNDVQATWTHMRCGSDDRLGRGYPVNGIYSDGTGFGQGAIPMKIQSPWVTNATGTAMVFNWVAGATVSDAQISYNNQSIWIKNNSGNMNFENDLFEAGAINDQIDGGSHEFVNCQFTGAGVNVVGDNNHFRGGTYGGTGTFNISAKGTVLDGFGTNDPAKIVDTSKTTQITHLSNFGGIGSPVSRYAMDQSITPPGWNGDGVVHVRGNFQLGANQVIMSPKFATGQAWKAIFIGNWTNGASVTSMPMFLELTDANNSVSFSGVTITFTINASGYFQGNSNAAAFYAGFNGDIFLVPRQATAGAGGTKSMQLAADFAVPSLTLGGGTSMTGNHGTGTYVQHSDGTGATGNFAKYAADGSLTDGGAMPSLATLGGVPATTTINGHTLSSNVTVSASDVGNTTAQWNANQVNGATVPTSKTLVGTNSSGQIIDASNAWATPGTIGSTTPSSGAFTNLSNNGGETNSKSGAASTYAKLFSGTPFSGGTGTTTFPLLTFAPTGVTAATNWSTAGTFLGINANSGFTGNFLDFRVNNGGTVFSVNYGGNIQALGLSDLPGGDLTLYSGNGAGGAIILFNQAGKIRFNPQGNFVPDTDNAVSLGLTANRFAAINAGGIITGGNDTMRTSSTTMTNAWTTTGLVLPSVPASTTKSGRCVIYWQMSSTSYTAAFGLGMNNAPTNVWGSSKVWYNATNGINFLAFSQNATAVAAISTAATAAAANTTYEADVEFVLQTGSSSAVQMNLYGQSSNASGTLSIMPGSTCYWLP
jgi:hypothetical protein